MKQEIKDERYIIILQMVSGWQRILVSNSIGNYFCYYRNFTIFRNYFSKEKHVFVAEIQRNKS